MRRKMFMTIILTLFFNLPLMADWEWVKVAGTYINGRSITVDATGNQYITGSFHGTASFGSFILTSSGGYSDLFVAKLDANGNFLWAIKAGESGGDDIGKSIVVDKTGNQFVTGLFSGTVSFGATTLTSSGNGDIFIAKLDTYGNFLWAKKAGGNNSDYSNSITVDKLSSLCITGTFEGSATFGSTTLTSGGNSDAFVAKYDTDGNFIWARKAGGSEYDFSSSVTMDSECNQYVTGSFSGTATFGTIVLTSSGSDTFIAKLDANGNFLWVKKTDGDYLSACYSSSIDGDTAGNQYITGYFRNTVSFGSTTLTSSSSDYDIFIAKLDANGNFLWAKKAGGEDDDRSYSIAVDSLGNQFITGCFEGPVHFGSTTLIPSGYEGHSDVFIAKLDANGNFLWAKRAGGNSFDESFSIALDNSINQYLTGYTEGSSSFGSINIASNGRQVFIAKHKQETILVCPNIAEVWQQNTSKVILWDANIPKNFNLEYTVNNGTDWETIATNIPSSQHSYQWTLPNISSSKCKVRILDSNSNQIIDESDTTFTICDKGIILLPPNIRPYKLGSRQIITWHSVNSIQNIRFEYTTNANQPEPSWLAMSGTQVGNTFIWDLPNVISDNCKIRIRNEQIPQESFSSEVFTIEDLNLIAPNGYEYWLNNSPHTITWISAVLNDLKIEYSTDSGQNWSTICDSVQSNTGFYNWVVPNTNSYSCLVRISYRNNSNINDKSENCFYIADSVAIKDPTIVKATKLNGSYPNPFNNSTLINYDLAYQCFVQLSVYNSKGELVKQLVDTQQNAGIHKISFDAANLNSGVYFYKLEAGGVKLVNKVVLTK